MAFTIIPGSSSAPTTYQGTNGVDAAAIISLPNESTSVDLFALGDNDLVNWGIPLVNSSLRGGEGNDIFTPNIVSGATLIGTYVNGNAGDDTFGNPQFGFAATISTVQGGQGNDTFYLDNLQSSRANGNRGDDELYVGFGIVDTASVNIANSSVYGGQGNDFIAITGGQGSDVQGYINTIIDGNLGDDLIEVSLDFTTLFQNSTIAGGDGNDVIDASEDDSAGLFIDGGEDDDLIFGGTGNDLIVTGNGRNEAFGGDGDDEIIGGDGEDTLSGGYGNDFIDGGLDADLIFGGEDSDQLIGNEGDDNIFGDDGGDTLTGDAGDDTLTGGSGADVIDGGDEDDRIVGGVDGDTLTGGDGSNLFVQRAGSTGTYVNFGTTDAVLNQGDFVEFSTVDVITDWTTSADDLDTGVAANLVAGTIVNGMSWGSGFQANSNYAVRGFFNDVNLSFTVGNGTDGPDILVFTTGSGGSPSQIAGQVSNWTVLAGAGSSQTLTSGNFVVV